VSAVVGLESGALIEYSARAPSALETIELFRAAGLNGPLDESERVQRMLDEAQFVLAARCGSQLIGLIRVLTDFAFNAFVADLAVLPAFQRRGIGSHLLRAATEPFPEVKFIVHPGHASDGFYTRSGFDDTVCMVRPRARRGGQ
jgi:ribosomal protein S18 acetylase RimI-like enzyme